MAKDNQPVTFNPLVQGRIHEASYRRNVWFVTPEFGASVKDMLKNDYWQHVAGQLRPTDRIEAWAEDQSWMAEFVVLQSDRTWAKVELLKEYKLGGLVEASDDPEYFVKWRGPNGQWGALRKSDGHLMKGGFASRDEAEAYVRGIPRPVAA